MRSVVGALAMRIIGREGGAFQLRGLSRADRQIIFPRLLYLLSSLQARSLPAAAIFRTLRNCWYVPPLLQP